MFDYTNAKVVSAPFPHVLIDDVLPAPTLDALKQELDSLPEIAHHKSNGRYSIQFGTKTYEKFLKKAAICRKIDAHLRSQTHLLDVFSLFSQSIADSGLNSSLKESQKLIYDSKRTEFVITDNFLKKLFIKGFYNPILRGLKLRKSLRRVTRFWFGEKVYPLISFSLSTSGYVEKVHTDARHKIFVGLLYLDDLSEGGEICILEKKEKVERRDAEQFPAPDSVEEYKKIPIRKNRLLLFINTNDAYHATKPFQGKRRFIYFSFAATRIETAFVSSLNISSSDGQ